MAPTVSPPSQTTGTPEITPSPLSSTSPTSQGTQTHKNQLKVTFFMSEYVASASVGGHCMRGVVFFFHVSPEYITMVTTVIITVNPTNSPDLSTLLCITI